MKSEGTCDSHRLLNPADLEEFGDFDGRARKSVTVALVLNQRKISERLHARRFKERRFRLRRVARYQFLGLMNHHHLSVRDRKLRFHWPSSQSN